MGLLIVLCFIVIVFFITDIARRARNKSAVKLYLSGMLIIGIGGFMGSAWSMAITHPGTGPFGGLFLIIGYLGHLLSLYTAILAGALVTTAWSEGHTPVHDQK